MLSLSFRSFRDKEGIYAIIVSMIYTKTGIATISAYRHGSNTNKYSGSIVRDRRQ